MATAFEVNSASSQSGLYVSDTQQVNKKQVRVLTLPSVEGAPAAMALPDGIVAYRHDWGNWNGQCRLNLNWDVINANSLVFVAIGEGAAGGGKFIGGAKYTLHNVAPTNGAVNIWVNIEWSNPIRLYVDYLVINP
ncbi:MAG: hypothetical protein CDV28_10738 [Candidatus Electronema aureum]|uniref:Uncharacterized protein n=1 Tax=Candidatus Electronema aureum TaxID=2005002 RepID=A0A521G3D4_9BACT|nr:MAG: hypothetical protein CDV28_10738 [Candidatus Electronema aureum]